MSKFIMDLPPGVNNDMENLYNSYKKGLQIDDCWKIYEEDIITNDPHYIKYPIKEEDCPIFLSADNNVTTIDQISSFCVTESKTHCIYFDRCKENKYWSRPFKIPQCFTSKR